MNTSEQINDLALALSKAQASMTGAKKDSKNPFFKSTYSDLASVMQAISEPFADNDLAFVQGVEAHDKNIAVTTRIMHKSGQWIEAVTELPPSKNDAQGRGSAMSYAKRYGLQALAGVPSVDDDGQAAVQKPQKDRDIISRFTNAQSMNDVAAIWGELNKQQQHLYASDKDKSKERLA